MNKLFNKKKRPNPERFCMIDEILNLLFYS